MVKNNTPKSDKNIDEIDIFKQLKEIDSPDILITSEESLTVTLFDDEPIAETEEEDDFETNLFTNKKKAKSDDEDDNDFDSYFFEEQTN